MSDFWLISVPGDKTPQQAFDKLNDVTHTQYNLSVNFKFNIPDLKVGTLDQLVGLSDDLGKLDGFVEQVTKKIANYLGEVLEDQRDKLAENLLANGTELPTYLTRFQWDMAKYPVKQSLRNISDIIAKQVAQIDTELKAKSSAYNNLKGNLQNLEKKQTGSLLTRNLGELVRKEHFVLDSEYLVTLLVVVPKANLPDWMEKYERLTQMIVPRSSQIVSQDNDHALVTVTLFHKVVDEFRTKARENRFIVREFSYNEESITAGKNELNKLLTDKKKQYSLLVRWLKINFSEAFTAWIHIKALRVFVESVLRYGLPVNFQAIVMQPNRRNAKRLREVLNNLYTHLDSGASQPMGDAVDIPGLGFSTTEYYPYVFYKLNIDVSDLISTKIV